MDSRQQALLKNITEEYVRTAKPVSSKFITEAGQFELSSATIRNEMAALEKAGYISHPHTSAGRIPTQKGYQFYVDNFLDKQAVPRKKEKAVLDAIIAKEASKESVKLLAKTITEFSNAAVFVAFSDRDFYYTGLSTLFANPEFQQHQVIYSLSQVIDHLDQVLLDLFETTTTEVDITIGSRNPFGDLCSSLVGRYQGKEYDGLFGMVGPLRMDYQNNFSLLTYTRQLINQT